MSRTTRLSSLTIIASALVGVFAHAGQQEGVQCHALYTAKITNSSKNLVCVFTGLSKQKSICSPLAFSAKGITVGAVTLDPVGRDGGVDQCVAPVTNQRVDSLMEPLDPIVGGSPTSVKRVVSPTGPDTFEVQISKYDYPEISPGVPLPIIGNPVSGVACPSGYDGDTKFGGQGIRCDKYDGPPRNADCDFGWTVLRDRNGNEDRCLAPLGLSEGPTKATGMTKVQFDAERALPTVGWVLNKKSGTDTWQRKVYAYPAKN